MRRYVLQRKLWSERTNIHWRREAFATTLKPAEKSGELEVDFELELKLDLSDHCPPSRISQASWRKSSREHSNRILEILSPGLTPLDHPLNTGLQRQRKQRERNRNAQSLSPKGDPFFDDASIYESIAALDPKHPVYNFLIEYYGMKGTKGVRRLMKWPPGMNGSSCPSIEAETMRSGILLEGATEHDFFTNLHAKGAILYAGNENNEGDGDEKLRGVEFSPSRYVYRNQHHPLKVRQHEKDRRIRVNSNNVGPSRPNGGPLAPFLWYRSLLQRTLNAAPVLHCYGLHEWAMQYQPDVSSDRKNKDSSSNNNSNNKNASLPPSSKYQSHLKLRVDQKTLNETVEANTLFCTHVDAWKFFAKEALLLNRFGSRKHASNSHETNNTRELPGVDERPEWLLRSEQPACVHTTMDLLKIALKLGPFCDPNLFCRVLEITVSARCLDFAASPYDAQTDYGVEPIFIETDFGRNEYKQRQMELMRRAHPIRKDLLENYEQFLSVLCE